MNYTTSGYDRLLNSLGKLKLEKLTIDGQESVGRLCSENQCSFSYLQTLTISQLAYLQSFPENMPRVKILTVQGSTVLTSSPFQIATKCPNLKCFNLTVSKNTHQQHLSPDFLKGLDKLYQMNLQFEKTYEMGIYDFSKTFFVPSLVKLETNYEYEVDIFPVIIKECPELFVLGPTDRHEYEDNLVLRASLNFQHWFLQLGVPALICIFIGIVFIIVFNLYSGYS